MTDKKSIPILATTYLCQQKTMEQLVAEFAKFEIKMTHDGKRMLLNAYHTIKGQPKNTYTQECNGLILEMESKKWKPLVVPPRSLRFNIETEKANIFLAQDMYTVYEAQDGTIINLYFYGGDWVISTTRGFHMNDMVWDGNRTFKQIVTGILDTLGLTWQQFTSYLSKTSCYTFGFRHKEIQKFQPAGELSCKIWFVQSVELDETSPNYLWVNDTSPIGLIAGQKKIAKPMQIQELYRIAVNSLDNYFKHGEICYGFILRSNNFECTELHSDLFVESKLMQNIKKSWYDNEIVNMCNRLKLSKNLVVCARAFLCQTPHFIQLFPDFEPLFRWFETAFESLVTQTLEACKQTSNPCLDVTAILAGKFMNLQLVKNIDDKALSIMRDFLRSKDFLMEFISWVKPTVPINLLNL